jgi:hypothetical protein
MIEGGDDAFQFNKHINKSLVPHRQSKKEHTNLKPKVPQLRQAYVPMCNAAGGSNTPGTS